MPAPNRRRPVSESSAAAAFRALWLRPPDVPSVYQLVRRSFSNLNAQANLIPVDIFAHRDGGGYSLLGAVPNVFATNAATYGNFTSASVYTIGADSYMVFAGSAASPEIPGFAVLKT